MVGHHQPLTRPIPVGVQCYSMLEYLNRSRVLNRADSPSEDSNIPYNRFIPNDNDCVYVLQVLTGQDVKKKLPVVVSWSRPSRDTKSLSRLKLTPPA